MTPEEEYYINKTNSLLKYYKLRGWRCQLNSLSRNINGRCYYNIKVIELSTFLIQYGDEHEINDVILHEIAHALTPNHAHDEVWRAKAIELGSTGERYSRVFAPYKYTAKCNICKKVYGRNKPAVNSLVCSSCVKNTHYDNMGRITLTFQRTSQ
jgi:hypothetical protein